MPVPKPWTAFSEKTTEKSTENFSLLFVGCRRAPMTTSVTDNPRRNSTMITKQINGVTPQEKIFLADGTELRLCVSAVAKHGSAKLYCSAAGKFFSLSRRGLNQVRYYRNKNFRWKPNVHSDYPRMTYWVGNPLCHILVAVAWIGPKPDMNYVVDHLNGNIFDSCADNLQWVTPEENCKRAKLLRILRRFGHDPRKMSRKELLEIFNKYYFVNPANID